MRLGTVLESVQDRCTISAKRAVGLEIVLDAPDGNPRGRVSSESPTCLGIVLILTQDRCMVCIKRTIGSEIILDAPDGMPR